MKKEKKDKHFIKKPHYPGGPKALKTFISKQLQYPERARKKGIKGTVILRYTIDWEGKVIDTHIISGLGYGCDEEAIRVVKMLRFEVPKNPVRALFHKTIHIHFRPPTDNTPPTTWQYVLSSTEEQEDSQKDDDTIDGYTYTINW